MMIKSILILVVATLHFYFLVLEMFLWTQPVGLKTFRNNLEKAKETAVLAANQGLYNGFLAAGLLWSVFHPDAGMGSQLSIFFLTCVIVAALYGGYSVSKKILIIQGVPAALALALVLLT